MVYCDAHNHIQNCSDLIILDSQEYKACSCALSVKEWEKLHTQISLAKIYKGFGVHPQIAQQLNNRIGSNSQIANLLQFEENLLQNNELDVIGEIGFDLYSKDLKSTQKQQEEIWYEQLEFAQKYQKAIVVHCRKAMHLLFKDVKILKKVPAVVMHSFSGSLIEAHSILSKRINAYFSCGKQILNNNKHAIECARSIELERLLLETDAPYQSLYGEKFTSLDDIFYVYKKAAMLRNMDLDLFSKQIYTNFTKCFEVL
ncbi:MAG: hypothetical protein BKP49_08565 [Treponema sp. CETP13]|nr:MAG: hypothetical protein BKP49_08565 [Treponema sp. CETP13]